MSIWISCESLVISPFEKAPQKLEHNDIRWITVDEIDQFAFCPADEEILRRLKDAYENLS